MRNVKESLLLSTVILTATALPFAAARAESLEMGAYTSAPGGPEIEAGDFDAAIASASRPMWRRDLEHALAASTNLCVAHTIKREIEPAKEVCTEALALAKSFDKRPGTRFMTHEATARALSNRGVLRALMGDSLGAADDFLAAARMSGAWAASSRNLAYLESSPMHRLALASAAN